MRDHSPSATALRVAALRALHQIIEKPPILVDPLAARVLGRSGAELLDELSRNPAETARLRTTLAVRSRIAEEAVDQAVARGVRQCVVLGAGLDTFAYRHCHRDLRMFEVDHPATQAWKRERLSEAGIAETSAVSYAAAHFLRDDLLLALSDAGFDMQGPAVFIMLGVVPYLALDTLSAILRAIADGCATGSEIVFDYTEPYLDKPAAVRAIYEAVARRVAALDEPWVTCIEPAAMERLLRAQGFAEVRELGAPALEARFLAGRSDNLVVAPLVHLVRARL